MLETLSVVSQRDPYLWIIKMKYKRKIRRRVKKIIKKSGLSDHEIATITRESKELVRRWREGKRSIRPNQWLLLSSSLEIKDYRLTDMIDKDEERYAFTFNNIYEEYHNYVTYIVNKYKIPETISVDRNDIEQDVLYKIFARMDIYDKDKSITEWISCMTRSYVWNLIKKHYALKRGGGTFMEVGEVLDIEEYDQPEEISEFDDHTCKDLVNRAMVHLDSREECVIKMRYYEGFTLEECGLVFGLTRERIRQIEEKALNKMKDIITNEE